MPAAIPCIVLLHTMDPRGTKLGGIETHVRLMLAHYPRTTTLLLVGIDEIGDLTLGRIVPIACQGRRILFLPVVHVSAGAINGAARTIRQSTTLRFAIGLLRYIGVIHEATRGVHVSYEIERFEFAFLPKLLRRPLVLLVHNEGTSKDAMDSLLRKYWFLHRINERLALAFADRIVAVNPAIAARISSLSRACGERTEVMSVSVDTHRFAPTPFAAADEAFHVCFAGRLDAFKDPPLMFATLARLSEKLARAPAGRFRRVVFDYVGASDPGAVPAFAAVTALTVRHGIRTPAEVAAIMCVAHAGLITSFFEGMPCYLLEMLASGRPVAAITLPQFSGVIVPGVSGCLVDRAASPEESADLLSDALVELALAIDAGRLDPSTTAAQVRSHSVDAQLHRLFACHRALALGRPPRPVANESIRSA